MTYHTPGMLSPQDVARLHGQLGQAKWVDGCVATGAQGAQAKDNQQVDTCSTLYAVSRSEVLNAVSRYALFFVVTSSHTLSILLFNYYQNNEAYGFHVGGVVHSHPQDGQVRTDLSAMLLLNGPQSYSGGELVVNDASGQHRVKLSAGDLVLYPPSSLHCMTPVTRGVRMVPFVQVQSMTRDDKKCAILFELDNSIQPPKGRYNENEEILSLLNLYHNLLRKWSEIWCLNCPSSPLDWLRLTVRVLIWGGRYGIQLD